MNKMRIREFKSIAREFCFLKQNFERQLNKNFLEN